MSSRFTRDAGEQFSPASSESVNRRRKQSGLAARPTRSHWNRILLPSGIVLFVVGVLVGAKLLAGSRGPSVAALGEAAPVQPAAHIAFGAQHEPYSSNPPTSGPHYSLPGLGPIACKTYPNEVQDEGVVHNLEHGAVWISYRDQRDQKLAMQLKAIADRYSKVVVSPRAADDSTIAVVSWGRVLKLRAFDEQKITDFIKLYLGKSPEPLGPCG